MEKDQLFKLQKIETEILAVIDQFCRDNNIQYSLAYGTLLGAVRHHAPIPWDDDVDICMMRDEYERFVEIWKRVNMQGYYLQENGKDCDSELNHAKIRKNNTVLASQKEYAQPGHHGIWVDVFALDKIPRDKTLRKKMLFFARLRIVYTRNYPITKQGKPLELLSRLMLSLPKSWKRAIRNYSEDYIGKYKDMPNDFDIICLAAPMMLHEFYDSDIMDEVIDIEYSGYKLMITKKYDAMLRIKYGNYMKLPPKKERICKHNPEIVVTGDK